MTRRALTQALAHVRTVRQMPDPRTWRLLRKQAGLTLKQGARASGAGTRQTLHRWETGQYRPRGKRLERYAEFLNGLVEELARR